MASGRGLRSATSSADFGSVMDDARAGVRESGSAARGAEDLPTAGVDPEGKPGICGSPIENSSTVRPGVQCIARTWASVRMGWFAALAMGTHGTTRRVTSWG